VEHDHVSPLSPHPSPPGTTDTRARQNRRGTPACTNVTRAPERVSPDRRPGALAPGWLELVAVRQRRRVLQHLFGLRKSRRRPQRAAISAQGIRAGTSVVVELR
jgi:hypothetical protein